MFSWWGELLRRSWLIAFGVLFPCAVDAEVVLLWGDSVAEEAAFCCVADGLVGDVAGW